MWANWSSQFGIDRIGGWPWQRLANACFTDMNQYNQTIIFCNFGRSDAGQYESDF